MAVTGATSPRQRIVVVAVGAAVVVLLLAGGVWAAQRPASHPTDRIVTAKEATTTTTTTTTTTLGDGSTTTGGGGAATSSSQPPATSPSPSGPPALQIRQSAIGGTVVWEVWTVARPGQAARRLVHYSAMSAVGGGGAWDLVGWSPDGTRLAVVEHYRDFGEGTSYISIYDAKGTMLQHYSIGPYGCDMGSGANWQPNGTMSPALGQGCPSLFNPGTTTTAPHASPTSTTSTTGLTRKTSPIPG